MIPAETLPARQDESRIPPSATKRILLEWAAAILLSLVVSVTVAEIVLRASLISLSPVVKRVYFSERPQLFRDQQNEFGYEPFSINREGAVYSDYTDAWVEYDITFTTNNAGLVQGRPIDPLQKYTVLVGDSFVRGIGATPWFYDLEHELPDLPLANLGVTGTGVQHWRKVVEWFERVHAPVARVGMLFITDDFFRPEWVARANERQIAFCYNERCDRVFLKRGEAEPDALIRQWDEQLELGPANGEWMRERTKALLVRLRLGQWAIHVKRALTASKAKDYFEPSKKSFEDLMARHPVAFALHLPEKHEAQSGKWSHESMEVQAFLRDAGVTYIDGMAACRLAGEDFHRFDDHPNTTGYGKITRCVAGLLRNGSA